METLSVLLISAKLNETDKKLNETDTKFLSGHLISQISG